MKRACAVPVVVLSLLACTAQSLAAQQQASVAPLPPISADDVERTRKKVAASSDLPDETKSEILQHYAAALEALKAANKFAIQTGRYQSDRDAVARLMKSLEDELRKPVIASGVSVPDSAPAAEVEQSVRQAAAELAARRDALRSLQQANRQRNERYAEITRRVAALDQVIFDLDAREESARSTVNAPELDAAVLASIAAQRFAAQTEIQALTAEAKNFAIRSGLLPLREQRAERRVVEAVQRLSHLEYLLQQRVRAETRANLVRFKADAAEAVKKYPRLRSLTDDIVKYAGDLFGTEGVRAKAEPLAANANRLREALGTARQVMELSRAKYEALGSQAELLRWYPVMPREVPTPGELKLEMGSRKLQLADAQATLVGLREKRANEPDLDTELAATLASLGSTESDLEAAERESLCRGLLRTRKQLLDRLIFNYAEYDSKLRDLDEVSRELLSELDRGYQFALERMYWRRSIAGSNIPSGIDLAAAAGWLFANPEWPGSISRSVHGALSKPARLIFLVAALLLLLTGRRRFERRLSLAGKDATESAKPLKPILESVLITGLMAAPLPLAVYLLGLFFSSPEPALVAQQFGSALQQLSLATFTLTFLMETFRSGGLAETQFDWSAERCRKMRREIALLGVSFLPAFLLFNSFGRDVKDHVGDPAHVAYVGSLGRVAFIAASLVFSISSFRISRLMTDMQASLLLRFPRALFIGLGIVTAGTAILSMIGWHLTAWIVSLLVTRSFLLIVEIAMAVALLDRLREIRSKTLLSKAASAPESDDVDPEKAILEVESTNLEVRKLLRFGAIAAVVLGLFWIWSGQFITLRFMERVQILPAAKILPLEQVIPGAERQSAADAPRPAAGSKAPPTAATIPPASALPAPPGPTETDEGEWSLTMAGLIGACLIAVFSVMLATYIPALLDFAVLSRVRMASGDRKAVATLVSYVIVLVGISLAASKIGLRWSQIQWLAAAFSFGLGFGLQDFFANFFSGLVLLFERPMRVGDFCRFGAQLGTVESIGLRSTRVRALDRTIINVPNADFSKKELVVFADRDRILLKTVLGLRYETTPEQLRFVLARIRELLLSHPKIDDEPARVRFVGYGDYSLNIEIYAYADTRDWNEYLAIQEDIFLRIMRIVEAAGTGFAFPSQTTYLAKDSGNDPEKTAAAEAAVEEWKAGNKLPFPDFTVRQKRRFKGSLDYPPTGSPHARSNPAKVAAEEEDRPRKHDTPTEGKAAIPENP